MIAVPWLGKVTQLCAVSAEKAESMSILVFADSAHHCIASKFGQCHASVRA
jgi:hypothetical protein